MCSSTGLRDLRLESSREFIPLLNLEASGASVSTLGVALEARKWTKSQVNDFIPVIARVYIGPWRLNLRGSEMSLSLDASHFIRVSGYLSWNLNL